MAAELIAEIAKSVGQRFTLEVALRMPLEPPGVLILFGPSGAGKTTVLRCLAGLESPDWGTIRCGSEVWFDQDQSLLIPPQRRQIGCVFQDYALFPTYSVEGNVAFGLGGLSRVECARRVRETLALLQLTGLERRKPAELSGGQQQRVALARAIARRPRLLLLDEPLSALDAPSRLHVQSQLRHLLTRLGIPTIVVTHDRGEALALGDHMAVIGAGRVLQTGAPQDVFNRPSGEEVARIVGIETVVTGHVRAASGGLAAVEVNGVLLQALAEEDVGPDVFVCIRAEHVVVERGETGATSARNRLAGTVREVTSVGGLVKVGLDCGFPLVAAVTHAAAEDLHLEPGARVSASIKAGAVHLVPRQDAVVPATA
jgi:molybdate transport system ATP-binding protein